MIPVVVVDVIGDIVSKVSARLTTKLKEYNPSITGVHYQHGHPMEIIQTLQEYDTNKALRFDKFPGVFLFQDFPETMNARPGIYSEVSLHMIIAIGTSNEYKAAQRYDKTFKPVLYPIWIELLNQLHSFTYGLFKPFNTISPEQLSYTKIDRLYWGTENQEGNSGNKFNGYIDCMEIRDLKLLINLKNC